LNNAAKERQLSETAQDRLIVALDFQSTAEALEVVRTLRGRVGMFKVGSQLFTMGGPELVKTIIAAGDRVFLDLKFHDIPHQVAGAARAAAELGVSMLTVHAAGGSEMMRSAAEAVKDVAVRSNSHKAMVLAVTVLTSVDSDILNQIGMAANAAESVARLATLAASAGVDGVVASPKEVATLRAAINKLGFVIVTPGIRPDSSSSDFADDQMRVATPAAAVSAGADYLVVGRPITSAKDLVAATESILKQIADAIQR